MKCLALIPVQSRVCLILIAHVLTLGTVMFWLSHLLRQVICFGSVPFTECNYAPTNSFISESCLWLGALSKLKRCSQVWTATPLWLSLDCCPVCTHLLTSSAYLFITGSQMQQRHALFTSYLFPNPPSPLWWLPPHGSNGSITLRHLSAALSPHLPLPSVNWMSCHSGEDD